MAMVSASLPTGFRDVDGDAYWERSYIFDLLRRSFFLHGFAPLETPAMEHLSTLMGKYGEEGDQLLFKVLNSGDFLRDVQAGTSGTEMIHKVSKRGLRYDLTVPLARYVAQHRGELVFPFKRYQMQPVWRADRPQRGRYREFYQCDVDVVGSKSLFQDASLLALAHDVFVGLGIEGFAIQLNHRALLHAMASYLGMAGHEAFFCQTLDKLDKVGVAALCEMLRAGGLSALGEERLQELFASLEDPLEELGRLRSLLGDETADGGDVWDALEKIITYYKELTGGGNAVTLHPTLARGLSYYTGAVFEVKVAGEQVGSVAGGGRYDTLTEIFGVKDMPGVGLSFGVERIYGVMKRRGLFPAGLARGSQVLLVPMEDEQEKSSIDYLLRLRRLGVAAELYPAGARLKKVFSYAHRKKVPWVAVLGPEEKLAGSLSLKNMETGEQKVCHFDEVLRELRIG